jgi:hypothetical protein
MPSIIPGGLYRLRNQPALGYFAKKYGTATPLIRIEDRDTALWGGKQWHEMLGNPAAIQFGMRAMTEQLLPYSLNDEVWYGKVQGLGELVFRDELEEV